MSIDRLKASRIMLLALFGLSAAEVAGQEFKSSVVGTDFDFITEADPSAFVKLTPKGRGIREMPDKRNRGGELRKNAFLFEASFSDGTATELHLDPEFATQEAATREAERYTGPLGKLPTALRKGVKRLVVHKGGETTTATSDIGLIVLFSDNASRRISTHDLEETVFHESVHASWDSTHARSPAWIRAQEADRNYVTDYAKRLPEREDLAESALFAYTLTHHAQRIPEETAKKIRAAIPNRIAYVAELIPKGKPIFYPVKPVRGTADAAIKAGPVTNPSAQGSKKLNWDTLSGDVHCNIRLPGVLADILSNTLLNMGQEERKVRAWVTGAQERHGSSEALFQAAVREFGISSEKLKSNLIRNLHVNCKHDTFDDEPAKKLISSWKAPSPEPK